MSTYERVKDWNIKVGNDNSEVKVGSELYWKALENQYLRIQEELNELHDGIVKRNLEEVVDAILDIDVTTMGAAFLSKMKYHLGAELVQGNNDLKYTRDADEASEWLEYWKNKGEEVYINKAPQGTYCIRRESGGKVLKPPMFPKVELSLCVPEVEEEVKHILLYQTEDKKVTKDVESNISKLALNDLQEMFYGDFNLEGTSEELEANVRLALEEVMEENGGAILLSIVNGELQSMVTLNEPLVRDSEEE